MQNIMSYGTMICKRQSQWLPACINSTTG